MKKILGIGLLSMCSLSLYAAEPDPFYDNGCRQFFEMATSIMKQKQAGVAQTKLLQENATNYKKHPEDDMRQLIDYMIHDAYAQPNTGKQMSQETQMHQFANKYYTGCMRRLD